MFFITEHRARLYRNPVTPGGFQRPMEKIKQGLLKQVRRPPDHKSARKLKKRLQGYFFSNIFYHHRRFVKTVRKDNTPSFGPVT